MPAAQGTVCVGFLTQLKQELKLHKKLSPVSFQAQFSSYGNSFSNGGLTSAGAIFTVRQMENILQSIELFIAVDLLHCLSTRLNCNCIK